MNVPSKVDTVCTVLPRLPSQTELIPLKLKRKLAPLHVQLCLTREGSECTHKKYSAVEINYDWLKQ